MSDRQPEATSTPAEPAPMSAETASLLSLIDRLGSLLERSDLIELEVESGETGIVLRKPSALMPVAVAAAAAPAPAVPRPSRPTQLPPPRTPPRHR